jgi:hypothetical protein
MLLLKMQPHVLDPPHAGLVGLLGFNDVVSLR